MSSTPRTTCPHCERSVAVRDDGLLWLHRPGRGAPGRCPGSHTRPHSPIIDPRDLPVLRLLADGHSTEQIAVQLGWARSTVATRVHNLCKTLQARNRVQLIADAIRYQLIS